jgi:hypothetical protein
LNRNFTIYSTHDSTTIITSSHSTLHFDNVLDPSTRITTVPTMIGARTLPPPNVCSTLESQRALAPVSSTTSTIKDASPLERSPSSGVSLSRPKTLLLSQLPSGSLPELRFPVTSSSATPKSTGSSTPHLPSCESHWSLTSDLSEEDRDTTQPKGALEPGSHLWMKVLSILSLRSTRAAPMTKTDGPPVSEQLDPTSSSRTPSSICLSGIPADTTGEEYPFYEHSTPYSSSSRSLTSFGYGRRTFGMLEKRTLVVGGVKDHDNKTYDAVRRWCEV